ncbi:MAG: ATP-binding cassette domain-containing protein [Thermodesulfobacteriota bacterium]
MSLQDFYHRHSDRMLVQLKNASLRLGTGIILKNIDFSLRQGENWLVTGKNGAGKSSFLQLLRGDLWPLPGNNGKPRLYFSNGQASISPWRFKKMTGWISPGLLDLYRGKEWDLTVHEVLVSGMYQTLLLYEAVPERYWDQAAKQAERFGIRKLLSRKIFRLSQGEAQKTLLARALLKKPAVLFVDEIGPNLDRRSKTEINDILKQAGKNGTQLVVAAHDPDEITRELPNSVLLENGRILFQGPRAAGPEPRCTDTRPLAGLESRKDRAFQDPEQDGKQPPVIRMDKVSVRIRNRTILEDFSWSIGCGEHWGVTGDNGSGKSTLLRLIMGEIHPLPGGRIIRFGRKDNWSIWELKERIGYFSPELQSRHLYRQNVLETIVSGFRGHLGFFAPPEAGQEKKALARLKAFSMADLRDREIHTLSYGQLRLTLLLRAVVHDPGLVLLDEPCAGLDSENREQFLSFIQLLAGNQTQIIMATHRREDFIPAIEKFLDLEECRTSA